MHFKILYNLKILLLPLVLVLLPLTFVAVWIKSCDFEDSEIRTYYDKAECEYAVIKDRISKFMPVVETPDSSDSD